MRRVRDSMVVVGTCFAIVGLVSVAVLVYIQQPRILWASDYAAFALAALTAAVALANWLWRRHYKPAFDKPDDQLDKLADAVHAQWSSEATRRGLLSTEPILVNWTHNDVLSSGSSGMPSTRFPSLPGITPTDPSGPRSGGRPELFQLYAGATSGRILIAGAPGSGKSSAAILLTLDILRHRASLDSQRHQIPVPLLFSVHGWDPENESLSDWIWRRVTETYEHLRGNTNPKAFQTLLGTDRVSLIIDGLDEMAEPLRPAALRSLNNEAPCRVVVLSRNEELSRLAHQGQLAGAVTVQLENLDAASAADYLESVQSHRSGQGWKQLVRQLRRHPKSGLARALNTPLMLSLVLDAYPDGNVAELLSDTTGMTPRGVAHYVFNHTIASAYRDPDLQGRRPGDTESRAKLRLAALARLMLQNKTFDLTWWEIPGWVGPAPRVGLSAMAGGLLGGMMGGAFFAVVLSLAFANAAVLCQRTASWNLGFLVLFVAVTCPLYLVLSNDLGLRVDPLSGIIGTAVLGSYFVLLISLSGTIPIRFGNAWRKGQARRLLFGKWFDAGSIFGMVFGLAFFPTLYEAVVEPLESGLVNEDAFAIQWLLFMILCIVIGGLLVGLLRLVVSSDPAPSSPQSSWRGNLSYGATVGCIVFVVISVGFSWAGLVYGWNVLTLRIAGLLLVPAILLPTKAWLTLVANSYLWATKGLPLSLMRFTKEARLRGILRTVGPSYQFRHGQLQEYLGTGNGE